MFPFLSNYYSGRGSGEGAQREEKIDPQSSDTSLSGGSSEPVNVHQWHRPRSLQQLPSPTTPPPDRQSFGSAVSFKVRVKIPHRPEIEKLYYMVKSDMPIKTQVKPVCERINVEPAEYRFAYEEDGRLFYLTEQNRHVINEGDCVILMRSPTLLAQTAKNDLESFNKVKALERLESLIHCPKFAERFVAVEGIDSLVKVIAGGHFNGAHMHKALRIIEVFLSVSDPKENHFTIEFVRRLTAELHQSNEHKDNFGITLSVLSSVAKYLPQDVLHHLPLDQMVKSISHGGDDAPRHSVALVNNLMDCLDDDGRNRLIEQIVIVSDDLSEKILTHYPNGYARHDTSLHWKLLEFQTKFLRRRYMPLYRRRGDLDQNEELTTFMDRVLQIHLGWQDTKSRRYIEALKRIGGLPEEYEDVLRPGERFVLTVRDIDGLTLHCLKYFEEHHLSVLHSWMKEINIVSLEYICPLLKTAILLSDLLVDVLNMEEDPIDESFIFLRMFFTNVSSFLEEFFCLTLKLVLKTWHEMRAGSGDLLKVFAIVREQLSFALDNEMACWSFDQLRLNLYATPYTVISQRVEAESLAREHSNNHNLLSEQLSETIWGLVREAKISKLVEGLEFSRISDRGSRMKNKFVTVRLSHDRHQIRVIIDHQTLALPVELLLRVDTKKQCSHYRKDDFALTIISIEAPPINLATTDREVFEDLWDGINGLIGVPLESESAHSDFRILMDLEVKLASVHLEGVELPLSSPPIPPEPDNYDFK